MIKLACSTKGPGDHFDYTRFDFTEPKQKLPIVERDIVQRLQVVLTYSPLAAALAPGTDVESVLSNHRLMDQCVAYEEERLMMHPVPLRMMWNYYKAWQHVLSLAA
jgi:hypothetical protein